MDDSTAPVGVEIAVGAEEAAVGGTEDGGGGGAAGVAEEGAGVARADGVGCVDLAVAAEAESGRVCPAVNQRLRLAAEVAALLLLLSLFIFSFSCYVSPYFFHGFGGFLLAHFLG